MYKYEMHLHTADVSPCASATHEHVVKVYHEKGYSGINLTNHWSEYVIYRWGLEGKSAEELADFYIDSYLHLKETAGDKLTVFCGAEITLGRNDYLVYNVDRDFMVDIGTRFYKLPLEELIRIAHDHGCLIYQAHPFRPWPIVLSPDIFRRVGEAPSRDKIDGMEAINYGSGDYYVNDTALAWTKAYNLMTTTGSDYHGAGGRAWGGIYSECPINTQAELIEILQSGRYALSLPEDCTPIIGEMHPEYRFMTKKEVK